MTALVAFAILAGTAAQETSEMRQAIEHYQADLSSLSRRYNIPYSEARRTRMQAFFKTWQEDIKKLDFDKMSEEGQVDYLMLNNQIERQLRQIELDRKAEEEVKPLLPFAKTITDWEEARKNMEQVDPEKVAVQMTDLKTQLVELKKHIEDGSLKLDKTHAFKAAAFVDALAQTLKHWYEFYNGYDPIFSWWVAQPYKETEKAIQDYAAIVREKLVGVKPGDRDAIIGNPIGREALISDLQAEMIPYTPEELIDLANKEFAWCEVEMKKASRELGYGDDWKKALEHVKNHHVEPGKQPELVKDLALEAIKYVEDHDLVTVPPLCKETWRMEMMSPDRQRVSPFFLGGEVIQVSFPTDTMTQDEKMMSMRGNNIDFARATVFHELIPGHHLQGFMTSRYRTYREPFATPFWIEGWALYWEMTFWDMGFPKTPENKIGMLFWRMHRCARIIFSLNFHLGKMTPQQCTDFLVERVGHERNNAEAEVRRSFGGGYSPLYQAAYMLGAFQFRGLRKELVDSGKMKEKAFHDAILHEGDIPIEMLRAILTKQKLTRDFKTSWRFYDR